MKYLPSLDRSSIVAQYPWISQRNQKMVVGTDLDATISSVLAYPAMGWEIVGFYDLKNIYWKKGVTAEEFYGAIWLDLDISDPDIKTIGHHILQIDGTPLTIHQQTLNPNLLRGVTINNCYRQKYPLATLHLLLWLWDINPSITNPLALPLYWLPDSSFINGQSGPRHFRLNVLDWLSNCVSIPALTTTKEDIETLAFEEGVQMLFQEFENCGWPKGAGVSWSNHLRLTGGQCKYLIPDPTRLNSLYQLIAGIAGWNAPACPTELVIRRGRRYPDPITIIEPQNNVGLEDFLDRYLVFSYAFPYNDQINYTIFRNEQQS